MLIGGKNGRLLRKRSPFSVHEYGVRRGQEHWEHWEYWDWEDTVDWTDRTGPGQADMDGQNGSSSICSRPQGTVTDRKKKEKIPDRVTLKKEIGLLSACTIIIGEAGKQELPMKLSAYVAEIYEVQKQAGGQAEEHCLLEQNEQQGPLNTPKHSKYEHHAGWKEREACMQRAGCS
eukprot:superscaffoldBa00010082_g24491